MVIPAHAQESRKKQKPCAFCENPANSKEHIWAKWMRPFAPKDMDHNHHVSTLRAANLLSGKIENSDARAGKLNRPGNPYSQRLRVVCRACNGNWMSQLQEQAKPTILPFLGNEWPDLSRDQQIQLSTWAAMFTMVYEFADPRTAAIGVQDRRHLKNNLLPPGNWLVFAGRYKGFLWHGAVNHFGMDPSLSFGLFENPFLTQSTAFTLGSLFIMTFSSKIKTTHDPQDTAAKLGLKCMWPNPQGSIHPPQIELDDFSADRLSRAFLHPLLQKSAAPVWS